MNSLMKARKAKGWSQARLAKVSGLSEYSIWRFEHGQGFPTYKSLKKLSLALDVNMKELVED